MFDFWRKVLLVFLIPGLPVWAIGPQQLLERLGTVAQETQAYQCRAVAWSVWEGRLESRITNVYFKAPKHVRMDILIGSRRGDDGSVAVLEPDGKVRVKSGSIFMPFALSFAPDHHRVTTIRGQTIVDSVLIGIHKQLRERLAASSAHVEELSDSYVLHIDIQNPSEWKGVTSERVVFDKETFFPRTNDTYEGSTHVQHVVWSNYIVNEQLPDELFTIRYDPENLAEEGIETVAAVSISHEDVVESRTEEEEL